MPSRKGELTKPASTGITLFTLILPQRCYAEPGYATTMSFAKGYHYDLRREAGRLRPLCLFEYKACSGAESGAFIYPQSET